MRVDARRGTFEDAAALVPAHRPILEAVRAPVAAADPGATEVASLRERSVWWAAGEGRVRDGFAYAMPHRAHVNLGFFDGVRLPDPDGLLEGTGKALRHVKLRAPSDVARPAVRALLLAARDARAAGGRAEDGRAEGPHIALAKRARTP